MVALQERRFSASLLRMRMKSPFFATLAMFARLRPSLEIPTAATDGRDVFYNPHFMDSLCDPHFDGVLLHEVLHAALLHVPRRKGRDPQGWNVAADIVINGIVLKNGFELPEGALMDQSLENHSAEEVYELLPRQTQPYTLVMVDLLDSPPSDAEQEGKGGSGKDKKSQKQKSGQGPDSMGAAEQAAMEAHWKKAIQQATAVARGSGKGNLPLGVERAFDLSGQAQIDWRTVLWRFLVRTPTDFQEYDRRQVGRGYYIETLQGETLRVYVCIDTSGSVDDALVKNLLAEVQAILRAYPGLEGLLFYADAALYGPHTLGQELPPPQGGGGTDFRPFFEHLREHHEPYLGGVCIYLTDGFGDFPADTPELPTLWVVSPGGLDSEGFPFGEVVRLVG
jgi:predicted metal-dependent peptidase